MLLCQATTKNYIALKTSKQGRQQDGRQGLNKKLMEGERDNNLQGSNMDWQANSKFVTKDRGSQGKAESQEVRYSGMEKTSWLQHTYDF